MIEDTLLVQLAKDYGTPLYVYDGDEVVARYNSFLKAFKSRYKKTKVMYAVKANSSLALLRLLAKQGCGADVVSGGELFIARKAGIKSEDIIFTSSSKTVQELELALEEDVIVTHGNVSELLTFSSIAEERGKTARICFRVNPDVSSKTHPKIATGLKNSKFGLHLEGDIALKAYEKALELNGVKPIGVHAHIGSQIHESQAFEEAVSKLMDFAVMLKKELGVELDFIDLGGGLGISHQGEKTLTPKEFAEAILPNFLNGLEDLSNEPYLYLEPGRYIVGPAGVLLTKVNSVKKTPYKNFVNVDAGFNTLARPTLYDAYHHMTVLGKSGNEELVDVAGNVCESGDILGRDRSLPKTSVGDIISIKDCGAYGFAMASEYNSQPLPCEVLVRGGIGELIRTRRSYSDLIAEQRIPEDLK